MRLADTVGRFREVVRADLEKGAVRPFATYLRLFGRQHESELRDEYARLVGDTPPAAAVRRAASDVPSDPLFFDAAPMTPLPAPSEPPGGRSPSGHLGPIAAQLVEKGEIARGGMGAIVRVRDDALRRDLAMKVLLAGAEGATDESVVRFVDEARIQAQLDHPGVVPIHHLGLDASGRICFTMKLVRGRSLAEILAEKPGRAEGSHATRIVQVLLRVCETMAYAHGKGVVHRDLKPANVMVGGFGEVYVMDWGLAKVLGAPEPARAPAAPAPSASSPDARLGAEADGIASHLTQAGSVLGTPAYMPAEQARGELERIDARSDVYSIGAILYEALAGRAPYAGTDAPRNALQILRAVLEGPPEPLPKLAARGTEELVAIAEMAMARDPADRYPSARELGADLQRWIEGRVVRAHGSGAWAEAVKWVRRNRAVAALALGLVVVLAAAWLRFTLLEIEARDAITEEFNNAVAARRVADAAARRSDGLRLCTVATTLLDKDPGLAALLALEAAERAPGRETQTALYGVLANLAEERTLSGSMYVTTAAWSPDGTLVWTGYREGALAAWETRRGKEVARVADHAHDVVAIVPLDGGRSLLTAAYDGAVVVRDPGTLAPRRTLGEKGNGLFGCAVSPDGTRVVVVGEGARVLDVASGREIVRFAGHGANAVGHAAWSPDGRRVATGSADFHVRVWDAATGEELADLPCCDAPAAPSPEPLTPESVPRLPDVAWAAGGTRVLTWVAERWNRQPAGARAARLWDPATGRTVVGVDAEAPLLEVQAILPDDRTAVVSQSRGRREGVVLLDVETGATRPVPWENGGDGWRALTFSADGRTAAILGESGITVALVSVATGARLRTFRGHTYRVGEARFSPDGRRLVTASNDMTARLWDVQAEDVRRGVLDVVGDGAEVEVHGMDREGRRIGVRRKHRGKPSAAFVADTTTGAPVGALPAMTEEGRGLVLSADGRRLAVVGPSQVAVYDVDAGTSVAVVPVEGAQAVTFDPAGAFLAWRAPAPDGTSPDANVYVADLARPDAAPQRFHRALERGDERLGPLALSAGGRLLAAGLGGHGALIWDVAAGELRHTLRVHTGHVHSVTFDASAALLATAANDSSVQVWEVATGRTRGRLSGLPLRRAMVAFSPDAERFAVATLDGVVFAEVATGVETGRVPTPGVFWWDVRWASPSEVVAQTREGEVHVWPADPVAAVRARLPRAMTPVEMARHDIGTVAERLRLDRDMALANRNLRIGVAAARRFFQIGHVDEAEALCARLVDWDEANGSVQYVVAVLAAHRGDAEAAFAALRRARDAGVALARIVHDAEFVGLRGDPRWKELHERAPGGGR